MPTPDDTPPLPLGLPTHLDESQAAAVWRRAAELHAEARDAERGYRTADVASAAEEAGIDRRYVERALAELPRAVALATEPPPDEPSEPTATRYLGTDRRAVAVTAEVPAPHDRTRRAVGTLLQQAPYELRLRAALDDGTLVFDLPDAAGGTSHFWTGTRLQLEARQLHVTLHPLAADRTAVTMTADLRPGVRRNVLASRWLSGGAGGTAALVTGFMLAKGAAVVASVAVLAPALGVAAAAAGLTLLGYRRLYPSAMRAAEGEMRHALDAVATALRSESVFGGVERA